MRFENFTYLRPDLDHFTQKFDATLARFENAANWTSQNSCLQELNDLREDFYSMYNLCHIRHTVNTNDTFYEGENNFFDLHFPSFEALNNRFYKALVGSRFRAELEKHWGAQLFRLAELNLGTFDPIIHEDLQEENLLASEYVKLKATAKIPFRSNVYNLSSIFPLEIDPDRPTRREANLAKWHFYETHKAAIEGIYQRQVQVRHRIARKLGYENFIRLGYARMMRSDYTPAQVANFRKQVLESVVPVVTQLFDRQRKRLGLEKLKYFDNHYQYPSGNPKPKGAPAWIVENAARMYRELSPETDAFFQNMLQTNLMDLETKEGKATGGYCTYVSKYQAPYIFSNFNGSSQDIDVLTHEAGHAFQTWSSRDFPLNEYHWPTYEACEIHSMSMEFFTWPWMELFFKEETGKYKFVHLASALTFLPYGVAVDEFQHFVYENPDASPEERNSAWRSIESRYLPHLDYDGHDFLEAGRFWQKQNHIFSTPFYYIDYCLAQLCALQFWKKDRENHDAAWADYLRLCKTGGSRSFLELVELANLRSPFEDGCVQDVVDEIKKWLDEVDDSGY